MFVVGEVAYFVSAAIYGFDPMKPVMMVITAIPILMLLAIPACLLLAFVLNALREFPVAGMLLLVGIAMAILLEILKGCVYEN